MSLLILTPREAARMRALRSTSVFREIVRGSVDVFFFGVTGAANGSEDSFRTTALAQTAKSVSSELEEGEYP